MRGGNAPRKISAYGIMTLEIGNRTCMSDDLKSKRIETAVEVVEYGEEHKMISVDNVSKFQEEIAKAAVENVTVESGDREEMLENLYLMLGKNMVINLDYVDVLHFLKGGSCTYFLFDFELGDAKKAVEENMEGRKYHDCMLFLSGDCTLKELNGFIEAFRKFGSPDQNVCIAHMDETDEAGIGCAYVWLR